MFKRLKEKLKNAIHSINEKVEEETEILREISEDNVVEEVQEEKAPKEKKSFIGKVKEKISTVKISDKKFDDLFFDLEIALLENNIALEVIDKIKDELKEEIVSKPLKRNKINEIILESLRKSIKSLFIYPEQDFFNLVKKDKPFVICFVGINGSGKTTTIAKLAYSLKEQGLSVVMAAADTFRAAAIDQLWEHAKKLDVKLIKHEYGSDAAAVAYDAISHAKSKNKDIVLIDTAGRLHTNQDLLDELKKIMRIAKPDLTLFVGESITGNDCVEQAKKFNENVGIDGIILTKADIDEKGGAAISISYVTKRPIFFLGTGQEYKDLEPFDPDKIISNLKLE